MSYAHRAKQKARRKLRPVPPAPTRPADAPLSEHELARLKKLAGLIRDDAHLEQILATADPLYRNGIRAVLIEHLTFTPQAVAN